MNATINLEKKLISGKQRELSKADGLIVSRVSKLKSDLDGRDMEVIDRLGMFGDNFRKSKEIEHHRSSVSKYPAERTFTEGDIKSLCVRYGLRFLQASQFNGDIDTELPKKILEHESKYGKIGHYDAYICAPGESFSLQERPMDPLFFVHISGTKNYYLLHKWGNDISWFRWLTNLPKRNYWTMLASVIIPIWFIFAFIGYKGIDCDCTTGLLLPSITMGFLKSLIASLVMFLGRAIYTLIKDISSNHGSSTSIIPEPNSSNWNNKYKD